MGELFGAFNEVHFRRHASLRERCRRVDQYCPTNHVLDFIFVHPSLAFAHYHLLYADFGFLKRKVRQ